LASRLTLRSTDIISGLSALALLAIGGAWTNTAFASTGADARCDQSVDLPRLLDIPAEKLTIEVVDHGTSRAVAVGELSVDDLIVGDDAANPLDIRPRVDVLLRKIFDEPQLGTLQAPQAEDVDARHVPLAVDKTENGEEAAATVDSGDGSDRATALPGVSDDDLMRFKQQMYRTDI